MIPIRIGLPKVGDYIHEPLGIKCLEVQKIEKVYHKEFFKHYRKANTEEGQFKLWSYIHNILDLDEDGVHTLTIMPGKGIFVIQHGEDEDNTKQRLELQKRMSNQMPKQQMGIR